MAKDYYEALGIKKDSSQDEIKRAYRELVIKFHPDRNKDPKATDKMKEINEAYAVLSDPQKRQQYDTYGSDAFHQRYTQDDIFRNFDINEVLRQMGFNFGFGDDSDIFSMFDMGQGRRQVRMEDVGNDILTRVNVSLEEAAKGTEKKITLNHIKACEHCKGNGAEPGSKTIKCPQCNGSGRVGTARRTPFGIMQTITTCGKCGGSGKSFEKSCKVCNGHGRVAGQDKIDVKIPRGVDTGTRLRVRGMGDFGADHTGDLYVDIAIEGNKNFTRQGDDLYYDLRIPFHTAAIGGIATVQTLDGTETVKIDAGTQNGDTIYLKGKGMPRMNGSGSGNEIIRVVIDVPRHLSSEQKELIKKLADMDSGKEEKKEGKKSGRFFGFL